MGKAHRDQGDGEKPVGTLQKKIKGLFHFPPVIETRDQDNLGMQSDACCDEPVEGLCKIKIPAASHKVRASFGAHRLHRDIEGREMEPFYTLEIVLCQVGEGDIGAVKKREAVIVIFDIERGAQVTGKLGDKTEDTVVVTGTDPELRKDEISAFIDKGETLAPFCSDSDLFSLEKKKIEKIYSRIAVKRKDPVPGTQSGPVGL